MSPLISELRQPQTVCLTNSVPNSLSEQCPQIENSNTLFRQPQTVCSQKQAQTVWENDKSFSLLCASHILID